MTFNEYQIKAYQFALPSIRDQLYYFPLLLAEEAGEVAGKFAKYYRDANIDRESIKKELGDVLWGISAIALKMNIPLQDVADLNISKLQSRAERNVLGGSGDNR